MVIIYENLLTIIIKNVSAYGNEITKEIDMYPRLERVQSRDAAVRSSQFYMLNIQ